ncbi:bacteriohemerythrin [Alkanindiges sp. WGS2144]|uniref:bacteriohemerythrin n=1 Tax=Alkanindiges sp. WGS2144 TaxID=3366808 RepID=UPI0037534FB4
MAIMWSPDLNTGIDVIDRQHQRIVDYINQLEQVKGQDDRNIIKQVLDDLVDYTQSHFAFEESLQEEAGYKYAKPHQKVHQLFIRRINEYQERFALGQDIADELHQVLVTWLINHIRRDDADYVGSVRQNMIGIIQEQEKKNKNWFMRWFS